MLYNFVFHFNFLFKPYVQIHRHMNGLKVDILLIFVKFMKVIVYVQMDKLDRKPGDNIDVWGGRSTQQKSVERTPPPHTEATSPSVTNRSIETTSKSWADQVPPCETVEPPSKPVIAIPEDKPKLVTNDVKKESEKKEIQGECI